MGKPETGNSKPDGSTGLQSSAVVMFDSEAKPGKDPFDAWKLESLSLYTTDTERHALDINAMPIEIDSPLEFNLDFRASDLAENTRLAGIHKIYRITERGIDQADRSTY